MNKNILIVEDEEDILALVHYNLSRDGFEVTTATTGEDGVEQARKEHPDLMILDLMLPGMDGLEVCETLKKDRELRDIPIVMLTAKGEESDIVKGLEMGAADYVTKPFSPKVLLARVKAVLRRYEQGDETEHVPTDAVIERHGLVIHPGRNEVLVDGRSVDLTYTEFRVLHFLASRPGWVFTRYQIVNAVRGEDYSVTDRAVDVQIVGLRRKLGNFGHCIETVRGVGYRFKD
ncbi:response regulator [Desulfuromonas acetoxidans]|uniref:Two component transcriptional regulator, winged helix family n=1 Tax=Desulfuromonas acetoxidans (strain DSM 684 / 11070) TaxID=281689 RepID=Q1K1W7_DESA6|nr:response regulator transcription factor [Desulfuromonas acetoxidans]EAT16672.1 two component transcriptional regulator, winged helix family [Desulfuromonas acetoxidans DSM 684]MBF0645830.1 response regulator transcription factor [Desulfuromonas acetoxidans]NVD24782.1 response regulator transcription factor [Desulfuromonas acetoxidans]NVE16827.1 response regulator transcription factor [Desulfuromonas acetoxidans]